MKYNMILRDRAQIEITEKDYNNISHFLGQLKLFKLEDGQIINAVDISRIEQSKEQEIISKEFRIEKPKEEEEERIRVPGGFQKISTREKLKQLWDLMKAKGSWKGFDSYENWEKETYKEDIEGIEAISKK